MWNKLAFIYKKSIVFGCFFLMLCIAYQLSFSKAMGAFKLNRQLQIEEQETQDIDAAYPQMESKNNFYLQALKLYAVNPDDQENRIWQNISGIALAKQTKISFNPIPSTPTQGVLMYHYNFKGSYSNCVSLLDSVSKTRGIGLISALKLSVPRENTLMALQLTLATKAR